VEHQSHAADASLVWNIQRERKMGGGSSGVSGVDLSKLTGAAEQRLRQLAQAGTHILFASEEEDRKSLDSHLKRSKVFDSKKYDVTDSSKGDDYMRLLDKSSVVVVFTDNTQQTAFLDDVIEQALGKRKQGIHAKTKETARIPVKATAYRWPSLVWEKFEEMFG
jgi:hypothetical protein